MAELTFDNDAWKKSSRSGSNGGNCVQVNRSLSGVVGIQDSKNPGPVLAVSEGAFSAFTTAIKEGQI